MRDAWSECPTIVVVAVACPSCSAPKPTIVRSLAGGDGSTTRRCVCRICAERFNVVVEPPSALPIFGNDAEAIPYHANMDNDILPFMPQEHSPAQLARQFGVPSPRLVAILAERGIYPRRDEEGDLKFSNDAMEVLNQLFSEE